MQFFANVSGRVIVAGQQEIAWDESRHQEDFNYVLQRTGKTPAVRGFDFLKYVESPSSRARQVATSRAIAWARAGGIVTFCVHMFVNLGSTNGSPQFYTPGSNGNPTGTNFDIRQAVIAGTPENAEFLAKLDIVGQELKLLCDAGVPVIWRPFHECGGTWFWWSRYGAAPFKQAWRIMFERFTQLHGLNNLVWCFNPIDSTTVLQSWYPGDDVVDMISLDVYPSAGAHPTYAADYKRMRDFTGGRKPVVMSENGAIPQIDNLFSEGGGWGYFCTWNGFENDVSRNAVAFLSEVFNHPRVITLDRLAAVYATYSPAILVEMAGQTPVEGGTLSLATMTSLTSPGLQWRRNGTPFDDAAGAMLALENFQSAHAGLYTATASHAGGSATSNVLVVGLASTAKVAGAGIELEPRDIRHPQGNIFDQVLLQGSAATITADYSPDPALNQITRLSYLDLDGDIVQVEFSGPGTLSIVLDNASGPALPANYNQNVAYMKGHAGIVIVGATEQTNVSVFSVGRATAVNPTLFKDEVSYGGTADLAFIAISSVNGRFGGVRAGNANFFAAKGVTGIHAPGVTFDGPVYVGNIGAFDLAKPVLLTGSASDARIAGGDLFQPNSEPVRISGVASLKFQAGSDSHGNTTAAKANRAVLQQNDVVVTAQVVTNL